MAHLSMGLWRLLPLFFVIQRLVCVSAQTTEATCVASWAWAENSKHQSPCLVAAYLLAPCAQGQWDIPVLQNGQYYRPPTVTEANECQCSTVIYQLMSACGSCQGQAITTWSDWKTNCTADLISVAKYPMPIPDATAVQGWAYIDITAADRFSATVASASATLPESTPVDSTSTTSTSSTSTTPSSSSSTTPSQSTSATSSPPSGKKSDTGAIVGGAVGGVVGLGLIICLVLFLMKRSGKTKKSAPSAEFSKVITPGSPVPANFDPAAVGFRSRTASPMSNGLSNGSTGGYGMQNMYHATTNYGNGDGNGGAPFAGAPWSPPPVGLTPAPSSGHYSSYYTPPPPEMGQSTVYTPPPGSMVSGPPSSRQYPHSHSNSIGSGYPATPYQNMPYGGQVSHNPSFGSSRAPEM